MLIRYLRFNILFVWLKNSTSACLGSPKNNFQKVVKEQFGLCISYMTISTPVWFTSILLVLSLNITNWSILKNEISDLIIWISLIDIAACWEAVKIILLMCIKLFYFTLNVTSMFNLSPSIIWCLVILRKIYFVIGRQTDFVWRQDCLPPLIRKWGFGFWTVVNIFCGQSDMLEAIKDKEIQSQKELSFSGQLENLECI